MNSLLIDHVATAIWVIAGPFERVRHWVSFVHDDPVLSGLVVTAIVAIIGAFANLIYGIWAERTEKSLWQIADPKELVIVAAQATAIPNGEYLRPTTGVGQIRALASIVQSLNKAYGRLGLKNIYLSTDPLHERVENDLLLLGGPKTNEVAA